MLLAAPDLVLVVDVNKILAGDARILEHLYIIGDVHHSEHVVGAVEKPGETLAQALWPFVSLPDGLGELAERLQGARQRFRLWKISACRQGAREAWAMVKTQYTKVDLNHMARVGLVASGGKEIPVSLGYD